MADGRGQSGCSSENFNAKEAMGLNALALVLYTLMENWCQGFRCRLSRVLLKPMRLLASRFGTNVKAAAAFSPWGCIFATGADVVWPADTLAAGSFKGFADELFWNVRPASSFLSFVFPFSFSFPWRWTAWVIRAVFGFALGGGNLWLRCRLGWCGHGRKW